MGTEAAVGTRDDALSMAQRAQQHLDMAEYVQAKSLAVRAEELLTDDLREVLARYGAAVLHPTLAGTAPGGLAMRLDIAWIATPTHPQSTTPGLTAPVWQYIGRQTLAAVTGLARPTTAINRIDDQLAMLIWARDLPTQRHIAQQSIARWNTRQIQSYQAQVRDMITRVPDQPAVAIIGPVLEFADTGRSDLPLSYLQAEPAHQPQILFTAVGELFTEGRLGSGGLTTGQLADMVTTAGVNDLTSPVLHAIDQIVAGNFTGARTFIDQHSGTFTMNTKTELVDAITALRTPMTEHTHTLEQLAAAVLECQPQ